MGRPDASAKSESHLKIPRGECRLASAKKIRSSANKNGEAFHRNTEEQKEGKLDPLRSSLESNLYHFKAHHHPFKSSNGHPGHRKAVLGMSSSAMKIWL